MPEKILRPGGIAILAVPNSARPDCLLNSLIGRHIVTLAIIIHGISHTGDGLSKIAAGLNMLSTMQMAGHFLFLGLFVISLELAEQC